QRGGSGMGVRAPKSIKADEQDGYLTGKVLIAMPGMGDHRVQRAVIYICTHSEGGAMGLVVNRPMPKVTSAELLQVLGIDDVARPEALQIRFGGPVESGRGFVLHSTDFIREGTMLVDESLEGGVALTATLDILRAIAGGNGPSRHLLAL